MNSSSLSLVNELDYLLKVDDIHALFAGQAPRGYCALAPRKFIDVPARLQSRFGGAAPKWWREDRRIESSALHVFYLDEAYFLPKSGVIVSLDGSVMASSYGEAKYLYGALSELPGLAGDPSAPSRPAEAGPDFARTFVTMPWGAVHNYGHFLLDSLPSAALLQSQGADESGAWRFLFPPLQDWHRGHLDMLNLSNRREIAQDIVHCRDIVWTSHMDHHLQRPNHSLELLRQAYALEDRAGEDRIWLSRAGDKKRHFAGDEELEARLRDLGFEILKAEAMTPREQARAFSAAGVVAGFTGAGFANALFCPPGARIVEIQPSLMPGVWVRNLAVTVGCEWIPYFCASEPSPKTAVIGGKERRDIGIEIGLDLDDFTSFLSRIVAGA